MVACSDEKVVVVVMSSSEFLHDLLMSMTAKGYSVL